MSREAMQMALDALESDPISHAGLVNRKQAITALRQALETDLARVGEVGVWGEWQGLTDEEIDILSCEMVKGDKSVNWLCKVLEAKLREKNGGEYSNGATIERTKLNQENI
jgi:hypothetical protein